MTSQIDIRTITVNQSEIDLENMDFHVPSFESLDPLVASIEQVGILHPPVVKKIEGHRFIPVLGRRRLEAVFELKAHSLEVRVVDPSQTGDQTFIMAFWDNLERIKRDISVKAYVVKKLFELVPRGDIGQENLSILGCFFQGTQTGKAQADRGIGKTITFSPIKREIARKERCNTFGASWCSATISHEINQ